MKCGKIGTMKNSETSQYKFIIEYIKSMKYVKYVNYIKYIHYTKGRVIF